MIRQSDVTENSAPCWTEENPSGYSSKQYFVIDKNGYVTGSAGTLKCRLHKRTWITGFLSVKYNESKSIEVSESERNSATGVQTRLLRFRNPLL